MRKGLIEKVCPNCGKTFISQRARQRTYCSKDCYDSDVRVDKGNGRMVKIIIVPGEYLLEFFPDCRPRAGAMYEAEKYTSPYGKHPKTYIVAIGGKRILLREGECVEVG